jgi:hypothetical protein
MGELPDLRDQVYVCGFPVGGDEISISEGVVSRIEIQVLLPRTVLVWLGLSLACPDVPHCRDYYRTIITPNVGYSVSPSTQP